MWNSIGSFVYLFLQWLITYGVTKLLGFSNQGIFGISISIGTVVYAFSHYGIRGYQVSDVNSKYSDRAYVISRAVSSSFALLGCLVFLTIWNYSIYTSLCILAYVAFKIAEAYVDVYHGIVQKKMRLDIVGKSFLLRGLFTTSVFFLLMLITRNLLFSISGMSATMFFLLFTYDRRQAKNFYDVDEKYSFSEIKNLLIECLPLAAYTFLSSFLASLPRITLENIAGETLFGIYTSVAIPAVIIQVFSGYVFSPMLPVFARQINERDFSSFNRLLFRTILIITALSVVVIIGGALLGEFGLVLLFGEKIRDYVYLFVPILVVSYFTAISWFIALLLTVIRDFKGLLISTIVATIACLSGSNAFIVSFSLNGASFILLLSLGIQIILMSFFLFNKLKTIKGRI